MGGAGERGEDVEQRSCLLRTVPALFCCLALNFSFSCARSSSGGKTGTPPNSASILSTQQANRETVAGDARCILRPDQVDNKRLLPVSEWRNKLAISRKPAGSGGVGSRSDGRPSMDAPDMAHYLTRCHHFLYPHAWMPQVRYRHRGLRRSGPSSIPSSLSPQGFSRQGFGQARSSNQARSASGRLRVGRLQQFALRGLKPWEAASL